jgi:hypothetical protein
MRNLMKVEEAVGVCKDRGKWKEVISACMSGLYVFKPYHYTHFFFYLFILERVKDEWFYMKVQKTII